MKNIIALYVLSALTLVHILWIQDGFSRDIEDRSVDLYHGNFTNEIRRMLDQDFPAREIHAYVATKGIPTSDLVGVLKWFANEGIEKAEGRHWSDMSISTMGKLRLEECFPYLVTLSDSSSKSRRFDAIQAIMRIGGEKAIGFAVSMSSSTNYSSTDRRYMVENIMRHVVSAPLENDVVRESSSDEKILMMGYLVSDPRRDEKMTIVLQHDEHSGTVQPTYRTNDARVAFLSFFCSDAPAPYRQQFVQRLENLRHELEAGGTPMAVTNSGEGVKTAMSDEKPAAPVMASHKAESPSPPLPLPVEKPVRLYVIWGFIALLAVLAGFFFRTLLHR